MRERKDNSGSPGYLVSHSSDIVEAISGVVQTIAASRQDDGEPRKRKTRNAIARPAPAIADVLRGDPPEQEHCTYGDPPMDPQKHRLPGIRRGSKLGRRWERVVDHEPNAPANPQQRTDDIDGATQTGGHAER